MCKHNHSGCCDDMPCAVEAFDAFHAAVHPGYVGVDTVEGRRAYCGASVTLNGKRATISGAQNDYATVAAFPWEGGASGEWAWETVARIVANGGAFTL